MSAPELIARCFAVRTAGHLSHLATRSYSQHMALQTFYEDILDATDEFAEVYQGLQGHIATYPPIKLPSGNPAAYIQDMNDWLEENGAECADGDSALQSLIDVITAVCAHALYRLKFLE